MQTPYLVQLTSLDARDGLAEELAEKIGVGVDYQANGQLTMMVGGHAIVQEVHIRELSTDGVPGQLSVKLAAGEGKSRLTPS